MKAIKSLNIILLVVLAVLVAFAVILVKVENNNKISNVQTSISSVKEIGKLEVMTASVQLNRQMFISKAEDAQYAALYQIPGTAIYSINLEDLEIDETQTPSGGKKILVGIPALEVELMVYEDEIEKIDEYQKGKFTGSDKEGYEKYFFIAKESIAAAVKELSDSDGLMSMAKESAKKQIEALITSLSIEDCETVLYFL